MAKSKSDISLGGAEQNMSREDLAAGRLLKVLPDHPIPPNPFYLIYPSREHLAPALRSLMDFVAERLPFA